ncbi:aquaporin-9 isoform X2 [Nematostella vectensis]|nr:aquaporin-9 isoform X2 [Nematostella vectensis]
MATNRLRASPLVRECMAEFIATFILIIFGCGSVAQAVLSRQSHGTFFSINFSWGVGVTMGCYWAGGISGAHMNPAVTLALAVTRRFQWRRVAFFWAAQLTGAFVGAACVYGVYYDALNAFDGGVRHIIGVNGTAGIFATYPQNFLTTAGGFGDQFFGTAMLVGCVFAITDKRNTHVDKGVIPVLIGLVVFVIGATFGFNCGYAINPARDLGPRLFTALAGWGWEVFTVCNYWAWVPIVGCLLGGIAGAVLYIVLIEMHHVNGDDTLHSVKVESQAMEMNNVDGHQNPAFDKETNQTKSNGAPCQQNANSTGNYSSAPVASVNHAENSAQSSDENLTVL